MLRALSPGLAAFFKLAEPTSARDDTVLQVKASAVYATRVETGLDSPVCRFCSHIEVGNRDSQEWSEVDETERLVAVPSVGPLLPGWLLVLPKQHALSLADFGRADVPRIEAEIETVGASWAQVFGRLTWFEHGPSSPQSEVGCSVDHAHMHLVPLAGFNLLGATQAHMPQIEFKRVSGLSAAVEALDAELPYLYLRTEDGESWLAQSSEIPSQAFRRVLAIEQGRAEEFDWKSSPHSKTLEETIRRAGALARA